MARVARAYKSFKINKIQLCAIRAMAQSINKNQIKVWEK